MENIWSRLAGPPKATGSSQHRGESRGVANCQRAGTQRRLGPRAAFAQSPWEPARVPRPLQSFKQAGCLGAGAGVGRDCCHHSKPQGFCFCFCFVF